MNKLKKLLKKQGFTLVELIIVIAIIAVLAVAAFMMLTKWLGKSRDSRRLGDLKTIQTGLDVGFTDVDMGNGYYPDIAEQEGVVLLYSGDNSSKLAYQGIVDLEVAKGANLQKVPLDPSDKNEYTYSVTANRKKFQLMAMMEDGTETTAIVNQTYALDYSNRLPTVRGYELGVLLEKTTNLPIQYVGASLTGIDLASNSELADYKAKRKEGEAPVVGTGIQELEIYTQGVATSSTEEGGETSTPTTSITETDCTDAGWKWVSSENDVYIGISKGDGFCISPRVGDFGDSTGQGISWNGWGNETNGSYKGWDSSSVDDTDNSYPEYGQTRRLDSELGYTCKALGNSSTDFDTTDNIVGRMKWLATNKANLAELQDIEWIQNAIPPNDHPIPALYIADCIDGVKDLGTNMTVYYKLNDNATDVVTYAEYSTDSNTSTDLNNITYQNRQKYLLGWTQKSGSHLPSAYSYIESGTPGGCNGTDCDNLTTTARGEYQVACDAGSFTSSDDTDDERIWLSSIGSTTGSYWAIGARLVGRSGCGDQDKDYTGGRHGTHSARFVVR